MITYLFRVMHILQTMGEHVKIDGDPEYVNKEDSSKNDCYYVVHSLPYSVEQVTEKEFYDIKSQRQN